MARPLCCGLTAKRWTIFSNQHSAWRFQHFFLIIKINKWTKLGNKDLNNFMDLPKCSRSPLHHPLPPRAVTNRPHKSPKQTTHAHTVHTAAIHSAHCKTKRPALERSQRRGTIHWGSEKSLTEAIYFPSQRESLFFTPAPLHSASCRNCSTLRYSCTQEGRETEKTCNSDLTLLLCR